MCSFKLNQGSLDHTEQFHILVSATTERVSISAFAYLLGILIGIMNFTIGLQIYAISATSVGKKYK